jgi:hypothetical protein
MMRSTYRRSRESVVIAAGCEKHPAVLFCGCLFVQVDVPQDITLKDVESGEEVNVRLPEACLEISEAKIFYSIKLELL